MPAIVLLSLLFICSSCAHTGGKIADFTVEVYSPEYATGYEISGAKDRSGTLITIRNPWQNADSAVYQLFISREGEKTPDGYTGQVLVDEAQRIVAMSSTHVAMLDALEIVDRVVGVSGIDFISNPYITTHKESVGDVGYEGNIDYELLVSLDPDIVLLYGVSGASPMEGKLTELGIPFIYIGDYLEESPLGKAEWLVALSEIAGIRKKGIETFASMPQRYDSIRQLVAVASTGDDRPKVMLNTPYADSWFMPPQQSYMVRLITDAGGEYIYKGNTSNSSVPIDMEEAFMLASEADVWLNVGTCNSLSDLENQVRKFASVPCVKEGRVYNNNLKSTATGGNDFFESAIVNPDLVLGDLVKILHPSVADGLEFAYYKQLK